MIFLLGRVVMALAAATASAGGPCLPGGDCTNAWQYHAALSGRPKMMSCEQCTFLLSNFLEDIQKKRVLFFYRRRTPARIPRTASRPLAPATRRCNVASSNPALAISAKLRPNRFPFPQMLAQEKNKAGVVEALKAACLKEKIIECPCKLLPVARPSATG